MFFRKWLRKSVTVTSGFQHRGFIDFRIPSNSANFVDELLFSFSHKYIIDLDSFSLIISSRCLLDCWSEEIQFIWVLIACSLLLSCLLGNYQIIMRCVFGLYLPICVGCIIYELNNYVFISSILSICLKLSLSYLNLKHHENVPTKFSIAQIKGFWSICCLVGFERKSR